VPRLSIWAIRTALLALGVGFTIGALALVHKSGFALPLAWRLLPAHIELVLVGWALQLALGVAYWILPRLRQEGRPVRGRERAAWTAYALLNAGIAAVIASVLVAPDQRQWLLALGRSAEAAAALLFAWHAWPRVKAAGSAGR
jgi:hypothetical protein